MSSTRHTSSDSLPDLTGDFIGDGRYVLLKLLGSGAYGKVYKALDNYTSLDPRPSYYAVKCLHKKKQGSRRDMAQKREFSFHAHLSGHPNVVSFHGIISENGFNFAIMDIVKGGDMFKAIVEKKLYIGNDELITDVLLQIVDVVEFAHANNIYHRDIKPENILTNLDGSRIFLSDFGLATQEERSTEFGCGSSFYMSPENVNKKLTNGSYLNAPNDVWAIGVLLVNMVTNRNPWHKASLDDEIFVSFLRDPDFLRSILPVSESSNDLLKHIFAIDPHLRITLPELREALPCVESYFMSDEELAISSIHVRRAAADAVAPPSPHILCPDSSTSIVTDSDARSDQVNLIEVSSLGSLAPPPTSRSVSSIDSAGPVTPENYPVMPVGVECDEDVTELTIDEAAPRVVNKDSRIPAVKPSIGLGMPSFRKAYRKMSATFFSPNPGKRAEELNCRLVEVGEKAL